MGFAVQQFLPHDDHVSRALDADLGLPTAGLDQHDLDVLADPDHFPDFAVKD